MNFDRPWESPLWIERTQIILDSYEHWLNEPLYPRQEDPAAEAKMLFFAPGVVVAHGTEDDPVLNYGNRAALKLWEVELVRFLQTPSRETAEPVRREERAAMLERTARDGYIDDYQGVRIASTGKRFHIPKAVVWNLLCDGERVGQAAAFEQWTMLESH